MRRTVTVLASGTLVLGVAAAFGAVGAGPAAADIGSPGNGAQLRGTVGFSAGGSGSSWECAGVGDTSSTNLYLVNSAGGVIASSSGSTGYGSTSGAGTSFSYETERSPNGTYYVEDHEYYYSYYFHTNFFSIHQGCNHDQNYYQRTVSIDNQSTLSYSGATSGEPGTSVTVAAQLGEGGGNGVTPPAGQTVRFSLSGGDSVSATTNASGFAEASLPVTGPARSATVTAQYGGGWYAGSSASHAFDVTPDPTSTTVSTTPSGSATFGQAVTLHAQVAGDPQGNGAPTGTVQFSVDGTPYGSPVGLSGGSASLPGPALDAGSYTVGASYGGDGNYTGSSGTSALTVAAATTSTSLTASPNPSVYGQPVHLTATVSSPAGTPAGSVVFQIDGQPLGAPVPLDGGGQASASVATLAADSAAYTITASFTGTDGSKGLPDFAASSASVGQQVGKASTGTAATSSATPYAVYGQAVQFTAGVTALPPGAGTPTGSVDFRYEGDNTGSSSQGTFTDLGSVPLADGSATSAAISTLGPGQYTIEAVYSGDGNFTGSTTTITQDVFADPTTTTVTSSADPSVYGQAVTVRATVAAAPPGAGTPGGEVDFQIEGTGTGATATDLGSVPLSGGAASIDLPTEDAGTYTVTATYYQSGDDFQTSSGTLSQVVKPDPTATAITSSADPSVFGQPVTLTATVSATAPGSGTPTGTVTFSDGSTTLGSAALSAGSGGDQATLTTSSLSVATHAITATYGGDPNFLTSDGSLTQTVNPARTATTVAQNAPSQQGQPVTFTATVTPVSPGAGVPTGTVAFALDGAPVGSPVVLTGGTGSSQATSQPITGLTPGDYTISATYSGDTDFLASAGSVGQPVGQAATTTTLHASPSGSSSAGEAVDLTATVSVVAPGSGTPTGTVDFLDGRNLVGSAALSGGQASLTTSSLPVGTDTLTASYLGEADFAASQSAAVAQAVALNATATTLSSSPDPSTYGQAVSLVATVTPQTSYGGTPTGSVTFADGGTTLGSVPLSAGAGGYTATLTTASLPVGTDQLTASYGGDGSYAASASTGDGQTVQQATTTLTAQKVGPNGELSATLSTAYGPVAGATLTFAVGSTTICTATTDGTGTGSCTASTMQLLQIDLNGHYTVTYDGDADYTRASAEGSS